jgi:uncharacterized protein
MTKPIGPICNLDCKYCYYLEKEALYPGGENFRMSDQVLEAYVRQYIESQQAPEIHFAWQGGEPTLLGVEFFRKAVEFQKKYCPPDKKVQNALQTNGTLLNDEWCEFFKQNHFLIGLSVDGPAGLHDRYRVDKGGQPTFDKVMRGLEFLKKHGVDYNTLTVVRRDTARKPLEVYRFLREIGSGFMQFIPIVERVGDREGQEGFFAGPPGKEGNALPPVTEWSVDPKDYGDFLCKIFDEWIKKDVGKVFVQLFEVQLGVWMGQPASLCLFSETCGRGLALEHNGDLYSCDHYVYDRFKLGNLLDQSLGDMVRSPEQVKFGLDKRDTLPKYCRQCEVRFACNGECPKHRFLRTPDGEPGLNYLCAAYKKFFKHIDRPMKELSRLISSGQPAERIMAGR